MSKYEKDCFENGLGNSSLSAKPSLSVRIRAWIEPVFIMGEAVAILPLMEIFLRLGKLEDFVKEERVTLPRVLWLLGISTIVYGLPLVIMFIGPVGAWICIAIYAVLIISSLYRALSFFKPYKEWDFEDALSSFEGLCTGYLFMSQKGGKIG